MAHRKGKPKTNASERTKFRYRVRNEIPTEADNFRTKLHETFRNAYQQILDKIPEEERKKGNIKMVHKK